MTKSVFTEDQELNSDELDQVAGGIIIVSGLPQLTRYFTSPFERVAINPQPLPPRLFSFGH